MNSEYDSFSESLFTCPVMPRQGMSKKAADADIDQSDREYIAQRQKRNKTKRIKPDWKR